MKGATRATPDRVRNGHLGLVHGQVGHALGRSLRSYEVQLHRVGCSLFRRVHAVLISRGRRVAVSAMAGHGRPWYRHRGLPGLGPAPATRPDTIYRIFSDFIQHFCSSSPTPSSKHIINEYDLKHLSKQLHRAIRYTPYSILLYSMPMRAVVHRAPERLDVGRAKAGRRAGAGASSVPSTGSKGDRIYIVYSCVYGRGTVHLHTVAAA